MTSVDIKPHPWSRNFRWSFQRSARSGVDPALLDQFDEDGYFVVDDLLSPDELRRTVQEIDAFEAQSEGFLRSQPDQRLRIAEAGAITFSTHLVARSDWLRLLSFHPRILEIVGAVVGPDARLYWDQAVYKKPEKPRRFPWHQDNGYTFVEPQAYLTIWIALTDATRENGCPQVASGLHRLGTLRHTYVDPLGFECFSEFSDPAVAEVPAGGAVVFSSLTPHLTGPNTTGSVRKAYILQFAPTGACALRGDPRDEPSERVPCDEPSRQYEVLRGGKPVPP
ncbi:MAG: phytanoyl-CoA dioxygenase family protein [Acidimicrobiales bacterium]